MKALFFLIVLANLGLFMWEYRNGALAPVVQTPLVSKEPLLLLNEVNKATPEEALTDKELPISQSNMVAEKIMAEPSTLITDNSEASKVVCYEAGPFGEPQAYDVWRSQIQDAEESIKLVDRDDQVISGYMVYYPAEKTSEQTQAVLKTLKDKGVIGVLLQGAEISLGVFNTEDRALILKNELQAQGFTVQIKPRYKTKVRRYVQVPVNEAILDSLQKLYNSDPEFVIKPVHEASGCLQGFKHPL